MKLLSIFSGLLLLAALFFAWGMISVRLYVFPYPQIAPVAKELYNFVRSDPNEPALSSLEKLESDNGGIPYRYLQRDALALSVPGDAQAFEIDEAGVRIKGYFRDGVPPGYILAFAAFNLPDDRNLGAVVLSTGGKFLGGWAHQTPPEVIPALDTDRGRVLVSGKHAFDWGCGPGDLARPVETLEFGRGHHGASVAPDGTYWSHEDHSIVQYDPEARGPDGYFATLRRIDLADDVMAANPDISPVSARFAIRWDDERDPLKVDPGFGLLNDPFHNNDVEPVVDPRFPTEAGYALMVSVREQNLVMILDPDTHRILWYRQGLTERQHDPDVLGDGIYVYNNRTFSDTSRIDYIPFESDGSVDQGRETVIDGARYDWFDPSRGQHSVMMHEGARYHLIVNDRNGRIMLTDADGRLLFEAVNILSGQPSETVRLQVRSAIFLAPETFADLNAGCG